MTTMISSRVNRSYLFAPGHNAKLLDRVFTAGRRRGDPRPRGRRAAEDAKDRARPWSPQAIADRAALVRVNPPAPTRARRTSTRSPPHAAGIRIPKCESAEDVAWVAARAPRPAARLRDRDRPRRAGRAGDRRRTRRRAPEHGRGGPAARPLRRCGRPADALRPQPSRGGVAGGRAASRRSTASIPLLDDDAGLRAQAEFARSLGFCGKSAIHPRQLPILHEVFTPSAAGPGVGAAGARRRSRPRAGARLRLPDGEFVDLPVAQRAQRLLEIAGHQWRHDPLGA